MQIMIRTIHGKTVTIEAEPSNSIQDIKMKLWSKEGYPIHTTRLSYSGKILYDYRTLLECNITNSSTLYMHLRLNGGMNYNSNQEGNKNQNGLSPAHVKLI